MAWPASVRLKPLQFLATRRRLQARLSFAFKSMCSKSVCLWEAKSRSNTNHIDFRTQAGQVHSVNQELSLDKGFQGMTKELLASPGVRRAWFTGDQRM